jgi:hypothetical protein
MPAVEISRHSYNDLYVPKRMIVWLRCAKNREEEEILQNGFIRVLKLIGLFRHGGALEGCIRKIMANGALRKLKNNMHARPLVSADTRGPDQLCGNNNIIEQINKWNRFMEISAKPFACLPKYLTGSIEGMKHSELPTYWYI